jgi:hypothetical protein
VNEEDAQTQTGEAGFGGLVVLCVVVWWSGRRLQSAARLLCVLFMVSPSHCLNSLVLLAPFLGSSSVGISLHPHLAAVPCSVSPDQSRPVGLSATHP